MAKFIVLGLMSGTSLDGLDLCLVEFDCQQQNTSYSMLRTKTVPYTGEWLTRLRFTEFTGEELAQLDFDLGIYFGEKVREFLGSDQVDFVASHGHELFIIDLPKITHYKLDMGERLRVLQLARWFQILDLKMLFWEDKERHWCLLGIVICFLNIKHP